MAPPVALHTEPTELAQRAADQIAEHTGVRRHRVAVVLGSGWQDAAAAVGTPTASVDMADLAGFAAPTALGHVGTVQSVTVDSTPVMVLLGRRHLYEGCGPEQVVHPIRAAIAAGAEVVVLTNAAGGTRPNYAPGHAVLISDHLNLTGATPLLGAHFIDMVDAWDPQLRALARQVDPELTEGVYAGLLGPQYETPAEVRMLTALGADLIGMSTVLEAIAARAAGARLLGISLVTNLAAGITGEPLDHHEVLAEGQAAARRLGRVLRDILARL